MSDVGEDNMKHYRITYTDGEMLEGDFDTYLAAYLFAMGNLRGRSYDITIEEI